MKTSWFMLRHYLVLQSSGVPLYSFSNGINDPHYNGKNDLDTSVVEKSTLFSGLLSSIMSLGRELGGNLKQIKLDNADLYTYEKNPITGVLLTDPSDSMSTVTEYQTMTKQFTDMFYSTYEERIKNWTGNVTIFEDFTERLQSFDIFSENVKVEKACTTCVMNICDMISDKC